MRATRNSVRFILEPPFFCPLFYYSIKDTQFQACSYKISNFS
nr:MAG TPA: hypothetical protein [Caudoviricetes sp.]